MYRILTAHSRSISLLSWYGIECLKVISVFNPCYFRSPDIDECISTRHPHNCPGHKVCVNMLGTFRCQCDQGFIEKNEQGNACMGEYPFELIYKSDKSH